MHVNALQLSKQKTDMHDASCHACPECSRGALPPSVTAESTTTNTGRGYAGGPIAKIFKNLCIARRHDEAHI
jgi:hypothetical protein